MRFQCPHCQAVNAIEAGDAGAEVGCGRCQQVLAAPTSLLMPGVIMGGDYVLHEPLVKRSHETDFLAQQLSLTRPVIVKVLNPDLCRNKRFTDEFLKAARRSAALCHPKVCPIFGIGREEGVFFLVREAGGGLTLKQRLLNEGPLPWRQAVTVIADVAEALDYAWTDGQVMHFNLKPDYIMLSPRGSAKLADLGLAGLDPNESTDRIIGTPQYIAPERIVGIEGDNRADLYSLGVTLFYAITGEFPFEAETTEQLINKHLQAFPRPANQIVPEIPPQLCSVIEMLLEKNPKSRYQSGALLTEDLTAVTRGDKPPHCMEGGSITLLPEAPMIEQHAPIRPGTLKVRTESHGSIRPPGAFQPTPVAERSTIIQVARHGAADLGLSAASAAAARPASTARPQAAPAAARSPVKVATPAAARSPVKVATPVATPMAPAPPPPPPAAHDVHEPLPALTDDAPAEGEVAEGEVAEGEVAEGEVAEGEVAEGEVAEGEVAEGEVAEGEAAEDEPQATPTGRGQVAPTVSRVLKTGAKHRVFRTRGRIPVDRLNLRKK